MALARAVELALREWGVSLRELLEEWTEERFWLLWERLAEALEAERES